LLQITHDVIRIFDLDYIIFDFIFLLIFFTVLIIQKKKTPIFMGIVSGVIFLVIDGIIWWNMGIREIYPSNTKIYVDFMMDFSYGVLAFSWVMIMFERKSIKEILFWTIFLYVGWISIASLSQILPLIDL